MNKSEIRKRTLELGSLLFNARTEANIKQQEVERSGIMKQSKLSKIENGELLINIFELKELAILYNKDINFFIDKI